MLGFCAMRAKLPQERSLFPNILRRSMKLSREVKIMDVKYRNQEVSMVFSLLMHLPAFRIPSFVFQPPTLASRSSHSVHD